MDYDEIYSRDHGVCFCGLPIDFDAPPRSFLAPSIDHFVPVDNHGDHVADNLTAAHHGCNGIKTNQPLDLVLIAKCRRAAEKRVAAGL